MNLKIEIETSECCHFDYMDVTKDYLPEYDNTSEGFKFSETTSIVVLAKHDSDREHPIYTKPLFIKHINLLDLNRIKTEFNGYFDMYYLVLPTKEWFDKLDNLELNTYIYYTDLHSIFCYYNNLITEVTIDELIINIENTKSVSVLKESFVSICYIKKYFIYLCNQIYENKVFSKCQVTKCSNKQLIYKRDLIWTFINLISYYTNNRLFYEAQRLIDTIENCDDIFNIKNLNLLECNCGS